MIEKYRHCRVDSRGSHKFHLSNCAEKSIALKFICNTTEQRETDISNDIVRQGAKVTLII